jgi:phosphate-selective porin OprO/OprP
MPLSPMPVMAILCLALGTSPAPAQDWARAEATRSLAASQATPQTKKPKKKDPIFEFKEHPRLNIGPARIDFRARVQFDSRQSDAAINDDEDFASDIARKRVGVEGTVASAVSFQIEREVGDVSDPWRDVYVDYTQFEQLQFRYGKFKLPFGLDENTSATNNDFVSRSLSANLLSPGRDRGWMVHGRLLDRTVRNARTRSGNRVFGDETRVGRLSAVPFRATKWPAKDAEVGVAWSSSTLVEGLSAVRGRTVLGEPFFAADYPVVGRRTRRGFEARWRPGPFQLQAEYIRILEERLGLSVEDTDLSPVRARGWYVQAAWVITGDAKSDGIASPKRPIFQGGVGAVEVAARVERLTFDSTAGGQDPSTSPRADVIIGNSDRVVTFGVNWYLNRWVKVQFNFLQETLSDPVQGPLPAKGAFTSRLVRFQFQL